MTRLNQTDLARLAELLTKMREPRDGLEPLETRKYPRWTREELYLREWRAELVDEDKSGLVPIVHIDLDGTLAPFVWPGLANYDPYDIPEPFHDSVEFCQKLSEFCTLRVVSQRHVYWRLSPLPVESKPLSPSAWEDCCNSWLRSYDFPKTMKSASMPPIPGLLFISDNCLNLSQTPKHEAVSLLKAQCLNFAREWEANGFPRTYKELEKL